MTGIIMYDAYLNDQFPEDAAAYAAYVDGHLGNQPNYEYIASRYPKAHLLSISVLGSDADCLDIEPMAATPENAAAWYSRQKARGITRPVLYGAVSTIEEFVLPVMAAAGIARSSVRLWTAHVQAGEHICGPSSCKELSVEADGTQWLWGALGRILDQSLLQADFFGDPTPPPSPPADWTYRAPQRLTAQGGHTSVKLAWQPPAGAPTAPAAYQIYVYKGSACSRSTLVRTYPRGTAALTWEGGGLEQGVDYTAHVVAGGPHGTRIKPYCYAAAGFHTA